MRLVQRFTTVKAGISKPLCEFDGCASRGVALYAREGERGIVLCRTHVPNTEELDNFYKPGWDGR